MIGCRPLSKSEVKKVERNLFILRDRCLFVLGVRSGFRVSELLSLRIKDVYANGGVLDMAKVARKNTKGRVMSRSVPLHPEARAVLKAHIKQMIAQRESEDAYLFKSRKGGNRPIGREQAWRILNYAYRKSGLTGSTGTHSMRKTFAKRVYDKSKKNVFLTQKALGHRDINSTISYLSFDEDEVRKLILGE